MMVVELAHLVGEPEVEEAFVEGGPGSEDWALTRKGGLKFRDLWFVGFDWMQVEVKEMGEVMHGPFLG